MTQPAVHLAAASLELDQTAKDVLVVATAADVVVTLPPSNHATRGKRVTATARVASTSAGLRVTPQSGDTIYGTTITAGASKYVQNTAATDAVGDTLAVVSDGAGGWNIVQKIGTWARES